VLERRARRRQERDADAEVAYSSCHSLSPEKPEGMLPQRCRRAARLPFRAAPDAVVDTTVKLVE
jgi:hypothetical protein